MSYEFDCPYTYRRHILCNYAIIYCELKYKEQQTGINKKQESFLKYHIQSNMSSNKTFSENNLIIFLFKINFMIFM